MQGVIEQVEDESVILQVEGRRMTIPLSIIAKAHLVPQISF
jgi:ribosome maturation factor RimP